MYLWSNWEIRSFFLNNNKLNNNNTIKLKIKKKVNLEISLNKVRQDLVEDQRTISKEARVFLENKLAECNLG